MAVVKKFPLRRLNEAPEHRASDRPAQGLKSESTRNRIAWTVAGLSLLALVLVMRVLLPPPAMAGMEAPEGAEPGSGVSGAVHDPRASDGGEVAGVLSAPLPATAAEAERAQESAAAAAARAVGSRASRSGAEQGAAADRAGAAGRAAAPVITTRPDFVSALEWEALKGVAAQSRDPARTLTALVEKLRFSKQLELFRSGLEAASPSGRRGMSQAELPAVSRADLAAQLLADLPARVAAGDMARGEALGLLPSLVEPLEPDPASRAMRVRREAARMPGQALQRVP